MYSNPDRSDYKQALEFLKQKLNIRPAISSDRVNKFLHLRIDDELTIIESVAKQNRLSVSYDAPTLSGQFTALGIIFPADFSNESLSNKTFYAVSSLKRGSTVVKKSLTPANFGLNKKPMHKAELVSQLKKLIPDKINSKMLQQLLLSLIDVAVGKQPMVDPELFAKFTSRDIKQTSIDFGEILTPLVIAKDTDTIVFPSGNAMLADVEINGVPISVKSASGSGTSFKAVQNQIETFAANYKTKSVWLNNTEKIAYTFFRALLDTPGRNVDKIIAASCVVNTPEHIKLAELIGTNNFTFDDLVNFSNSFNSYSEFLKTIYPVSIAGEYFLNGSKRPNGLPADHKFYLGITSTRPVAKQAGKPSWDANQGKAGANILTYVLGTSFLADARKPDNAAHYNKLLKRILGNANAKLVKIDINNDGTLGIYKKEFKDVDFNFQYHAPSHIPGNNLPGFAMALDK